jgi:hypothetical protein
MSIDLTVEVKCENCGKDLECYINSKSQIEVTYCEKCRDDIYQEGYDEGYKEGSKED